MVAALAFDNLSPDFLARFNKDKSQRPGCEAEGRLTSSIYPANHVSHYLVELRRRCIIRSKKEKSIDHPADP
jgi:hypothetical protein